MNPNPNKETPNRGHAMSELHIYYAPIFFREKDPANTKCTLLIRKYKRYTTKSGKEALAYATDVSYYEDEQQMVADIKAQDMQELPPKADGNPSYVPEELKTSYMRKVQKL